MPDPQSPERAAALTASAQRRLDQLMVEISNRLLPVCGNMPANEFAEMVRKAAVATQRWEQRAGTRDGGARAE